MKTIHRRLLKEFLIELSIYAVFVLLYLFLVLGLLGKFMASIFSRDIVLYTVLALGLIITQGVVLEYITSFLMDRLEIGTEYEV